MNKIYKGTSETTRETSNWKYWFIGFIEGDGSFIVSPKEKRHFFIINQKDPKVLYVIKEKLGYGKISQYKNYYRFIVSKRQDIYDLITIIHDNLLLDKTNLRFKIWVDKFKEWHDDSPELVDSNLYLNDVAVALAKDFIDKGWLAGFIDAEGCFNATKIESTHKTKKNLRIRLRFILDQKDELRVLKNIQEYLEGGYITIRDKENLYYRYVIQSLKDHEKIINYLERHSLLSNKYIGYTKYKKLYRRILNKDNKNIKSEKVKLKLENLMKTINN